MKHAKTLETLGTAGGVIGAFLVAGKMPEMGYPFFFASSLCLLISAVAQKQRNFIVLQGVFFSANILGLVNYL